MACAGQKKASVAVGEDVRLVDRVSLGVLAEVVSRDLIEEVLDETGKREQRTRLLPAHVMVRFCQAMCLFFDDDYEEVMRKLVGSLKSMGSWRGEWHVPSTSAVAQARQRLGSEPLRVLFERVAVPVAGPGARGAWLRSRRVMAVDGVMLDLQDTPENVAEFGKSGNGHKASGFPQALVVALAECGSHAIVDAVISGYRGDEKALSRTLLGSVGAGMLVTADRNFYSYSLWEDFLDTGVDLLWRIGSGVELPVLKWLSDGSYDSILLNPQVRAGRRRQVIADAAAGKTVGPEQGFRVRVVEYEVPDREGNGTGEVVCLATTIPEPSEATAAELAWCYHQRWEIESVFDEIKTHQRGGARILRSKSPDMVRQEIWAFLLTHYAIRSLMSRAADEADVDPDELSFIRALRVVRRQVTAQADFSP
ncbi:IS4 family transposase [Actinosynnema sp. NPDC047251]|uniref:Transposase, IS4 family n=1 Tax=Saccharothrix espanaensis (strain ATCC 51144 / DSM 44229 / JCM 9112 / NBRC 15066 / NRRL 15764) TaxID=1179773 RepID=K0JWE3_SACES|nr:IS4 family transposase [Saccharothrix espanaensis]CCH30376.1 Transposase, IS4 family [Saccharothrix espanaensis DSM 44229]